MGRRRREWRRGESERLRAQLQHCRYVSVAFSDKLARLIKFLIGTSRSSFRVPIDLRMLSGQARTLAQIRQHTSVPFSCCGVLSSSSRLLAWPAPQYKRPPWLLA